MSVPTISQDQLKPSTEDKSSYDLLKDDVRIDEPIEDLLADDPVDDVVDDDVKADDVEEVEEEDKEEEIEEATDENEPVVDPDDIQLQTPVKLKELLAKYPNFKKEFPEVLAANYREQKYAELLPTIEDAKVAVERSETLGKFEEKIFSGETAPILSIVKEEDPVAFAKIVDNYLPTLHKTDSRAYFHVVGGVINQLAHEMFQAGESNGNEDLKVAAQLLYKYTFQDRKQPESFGNTNPKETEELSKIKKEREDFEKQKYESVSNELATKTDNLIKSTIDKNIDPKGTMPPYVRRNAINDALKLVKSSIEADARFNKIIEGMWANAKKNNYRPDDVNKIRMAILGKSKAHLKDAIIKTRNEALKGISQRSSSGTTEKKTVVKTRTSANKADGKPEGRLTTFDLLS